MKHSDEIDSLLDFDMADYMTSHEDIYNAIRTCIVEEDGKDLIAVLSAALEAAKRIADKADDADVAKTTQEFVLKQAAPGMNTCEMCVLEKECASGEIREDLGCIRAAEIAGIPIFRSYWDRAE
jgi:DNA-binding phage protein